MSRMSAGTARRPTAIRTIMAPLAALLPAAAPGISARQAHTELGQYAPTTVRIALDLLERDGRATSIIVPGAKGMPTRFFRRIGKEG